MCVCMHADVYMGEYWVCMCAQRGCMVVCVVCVQKNAGLCDACVNTLVEWMFVIV
jgi:hypothetical protein